MQRETKSARILELLERGDFTDQEIANAVGCLDAYVRTVRARKKGGGISIADRNWAAKIAQVGGFDAARAAQKAEYRRLRNAGFSTVAATRISMREWTRAACRSVKDRSRSHA